MLLSAVTALVRAKLDSDPTHGAIVPPICLSSNFSFAGFAQARKYDYTRSGNPTRDAFAETLAQLEGGAGAVVTSSGMAAIFLVLQLLPAGARLLAPHDCYGGSYRLFESLAQRGQFRVEFVDQTDPIKLAEALKTPADMLWIETPSNPLLRITDLQTAAHLGKQAGALVVADNTFLSPLWQSPLALGADVVVHSTTKYINGHSDVVGGAVIAKDKAVHETLSWWANNIGLSGAPFDAWLQLRGIRTLSARLKVHEANALEIAALLDRHPAVKRVHFPGLADHPGHELACAQQSSFGAMLSFELNGGIPQIKALLDGLSLYSLAESLGGVESLIAHPATMTHASMSATARAGAGISDALLRVSVGIEDANDLLRDLRAGLDRAAQIPLLARAA